jgi:MerR family transcriptional regulator, light-induced transcriptional regulator
MGNPAQLPIRTIASLTGVNAITLRAWERRYGLIQPLRTGKGHRLYTHDHVEQIRRVLALLDHGIQVSRVKEVLEAEAPSRGAARKGPWAAYLERMSAAIARFDEREIDRIYEDALSVYSPGQVTRQLTLPLLEQLGMRWQKLKGAVAEEHFFATCLRSKLGARLQHRSRYAAGPRLMAACAPGEHHEIGLLLFALEATEAGFRTVILGADTPLAETALACRRSGADGVVISSSVDPAPRLLERDLPALVREAGVPVFVGGSTSLRHRQAVQAAGAHAVGTDLEDGVRLIQATLGKQKEAA